MLFDLNLSRHPFLRQVVDLDLLLCTVFNSEGAVLFWWHIQQLLAYSIEHFISLEKESACCCLKIETVLQGWWHVFLKRAWPRSWKWACRGQQQLLQTRKHPVFVLSGKQCQRAAPRAWQLSLPPKPSITFWISLPRDCQMTDRGSNLDSIMNSAAWPTSCKGLIASQITA